MSLPNGGSMGEKLSPFDFVNAINTTKQDLYEQGYTDDEYVPFLINRQLSYFMDTVFFANEANSTLKDAPKRAQFDFLRLTIDKRKRFARWGKVRDNPDIELIQRRYGGTRQTAEELLKLLSKEELEALRAKEDTGGIKEGRKQ